MKALWLVTHTNIELVTSHITNNGPSVTSHGRRSRLRIIMCKCLLWARPRACPLSCAWACVSLKDSLVSKRDGENREWHDSGHLEILFQYWTLFPLLMIDILTVSTPTLTNFISSIFIYVQFVKNTTMQTFHSMNKHWVKMKIFIILWWNVHKCFDVWLPI